MGPSCEALQLPEAEPASHPTTSEIVLLDDNAVILAVNSAWRHSLTVLGVHTPRFGVGMSYPAVVRKFLMDFDEDDLRADLADLRAGRRREIRHAYAVETARGPRWRQLHITAMPYGRATRYVAIHEDLTELVRAQEALRRTSESLLTAQDDERQRIALELHDSTSQHLAALGMGVARLRRLTQDAQVGSVLDDMARSLREAVKETRVLSYLLKPVGLLQEGLEATARRLVTGFGQRSEIITTFTASGCFDDLAAPVEHAAFRILQEALSNAHRHAAASRVDVSLSVERDELVVTVSDDGRGMPPLILTPSGETHALGVGIAGMRARVAQLSGQLLVGGGPVGVRIEARIPLGGQP